MNLRRTKNSTNKLSGEWEVELEQRGLMEKKNVVFFYVLEYSASFKT